MKNHSLHSPLIFSLQTMEVQIFFLVIQMMEITTKIIKAVIYFKALTHFAMKIEVSCSIELKTKIKELTI